MTSKQPKRSGEHPKEQAGASKRREVVLVLDDELSLLGALKRALEKEAFHVLTTDTIRGARKVLENSLVHCVVADERLADGSGAHFLIDVGERFPSVGRVLLSGYLEPRLVQLGREHSFQTIEKGAWFDDLVAAIRRELERER